MITRRIRETEEDIFGACAAGETCFVCGKVVSDPAIMWQGATARIYLHGVCAMRWTAKLMTDIAMLYGNQERK